MLNETSSIVDAETISTIYEVIKNSGFKHPVYKVRRAIKVKTKNGKQITIPIDNYLTIDKKSNEIYLITYGPVFEQDKSDSTIEVDFKEEVYMFATHVGNQRIPPQSFTIEK